MWIVKVKWDWSTITRKKVINDRLMQANDGYYYGKEEKNSFLDYHNSIFNAQRRTSENVWRGFCLKSQLPFLVTFGIWCHPTNLPYITKYASSDFCLSDDLRSFSFPCLKMHNTVLSIMDWEVLISKHTGSPHKTRKHLYCNFFMFISLLISVMDQGTLPHLNWNICNIS